MRQQEKLLIVLRPLTDVSNAIALIQVRDAPALRIR